MRERQGGQEQTDGARSTPAKLGFTTVRVTVDGECLRLFGVAFAWNSPGAAASSNLATDVLDWLPSALAGMGAFRSTGRSATHQSVNKRGFYQLRPGSTFSTVNRGGSEARSLRTESLTRGAHGSFNNLTAPDREGETAQFSYQTLLKPDSLRTLGVRTLRPCSSKS